MVEVCIKSKEAFKSDMYNSQIIETVYKGELTCKKHGELEKALWIGKVGADFCIECLKEALEQGVTL